MLLEDKPGPLLLYFSAHWCPPCKRFTPELVKFFDTLKAKHADANCCFVSSDKDQGSFDGYFGEMGANWLALPSFPARSFADESRRRRGCHVDSPWRRRVAATSRPRLGRRKETGARRRYSARDAKTDLSKAFDVSGIPTLVLLSAADAAGKRTVGARRRNRRPSSPRSRVPGRGVAATPRRIVRPRPPPRRRRS